jgi:hypothetical protein
MDAALDRERARYAAVHSVYKQMLAERDKNESVIRNQLNAALSRLARSTDENAALRSGILIAAIQRRNTVPYTRCHMKVGHPMHASHYPKRNV